MRQIRVLMIVPNLRVSNGVASFAINYYRKLDPSKIHMDFALYSDRPSPYYEEIQQLGSTIYILPQVKNLKEHLRKCNEILVTKKYDVIHNNTLHISIPMMWCAKRAGISVRILHSHNTRLGETRKKEVRNKFFLPVLRGLATDFAACSRMAGTAMFGNREFTIVPNVIASEKYHFEEERRLAIRSQMNAAGKVIVGTVGRLAKQKNPYFAINVFKKLQIMIPNAEYWWIGSGELDNQVKRYVESQGLAEKVKLLGSRNDALDLYQAMDCFFLPSLFEGLPVTGVEAQAMGLPMVVSDTITDEMVYTELVDHISLGEPVNAWVKFLANALSRKVNREVYSNELKQSIFSDVGCGERLIKVYDGLLRRHGGE